MEAALGHIDENEFILQTHQETLDYIATIRNLNITGG